MKDATRHGMYCDQASKLYVFFSSCEIVIAVSVTRHTKPGIRDVTCLNFELATHAKLLVCFDNDVRFIKVFNDETVLLVHREQDLLHSRVAEHQSESVEMDGRSQFYHVRRTPDENSDVNVVINDEQKQSARTFDSLHRPLGISTCLNVVARNVRWLPASSMREETERTK